VRLYAYARSCIRTRFILAPAKWEDLGVCFQRVYSGKSYSGIWVESVIACFSLLTSSSGRQRSLPSVGLGVNIVSALLLGHGHSHGHDHHDHHDHDHRFLTEVIKQTFQVRRISHDDCRCPGRLFLLPSLPCSAGPLPRIGSGLNPAMGIVGAIVNRTMGLEPDGCRLRVF